MLPGVEQGVDVWSDGSGMPPSKVADHLFDAAIESGDFCEGAVTPSRVCARASLTRKCFRCLDLC